MTTVSSRTGYTPFFMLHGREARQPSDIWISAFRNISHLSVYVKDLVDTLHNSWIDEAVKKPGQVDAMNKVHIPRADFTEFQVGDRFFLRRVPTPAFKYYDNPNRKAKDALKASLQRRYTGPYVVSRKFSPVLYETVINNVPRVVHALHMKPDPIAEPLRGNIPLARSTITQLPRILDREHISAVVPVQAPTQPAEASSSSSSESREITPQTDSQAQSHEQEEEEEEED
jgi:hypothetical protein